MAVARQRLACDHPLASGDRERQITGLQPPLSPRVSLLNKVAPSLPAAGDYTVRWLGCSLFIKFGLNFMAIQS